MTIALVGHCGPDMYMLRSAVRQALPDFEIVSINDEETLRGQTGSDSLLLVNRVLDGDFSTSSGIALMTHLASKGEAPRWMLISNFPEAHQEAMTRGALPGFGKSSAYARETRGILQRAVGETPNLPELSPQDGVENDTGRS